MRIGVIAAEMEGRSTGVGRYLEGLLAGLQSWDHGCQWHLFFQGDTPPAGVPFGDAFTPHCSGYRGRRVFWEQLRLPRELARHELDLVFGPSYALPLVVRGPSAVTIHDLSFELVPGDFAPRERWRRRLAARRAARVANRVVTDIGHVAELVERRYGVARDRIAVVPLGVDRVRFTPAGSGGDGAALDRAGIRSPYLLWLGSLLDRRRPREVLEAFAAILETRPGLQLVVAGDNRLRRPRHIARWIDALGLGDAVRLLGWVDDELLPPLYRGAEFCIYVSSHEGFGLPPLEALACGTPAVVSGGLALDDLWPDYPYRCRELTASAIAEMAFRILDEGAVATEVAAAAGERLAGCNWRTASRALTTELRRVVEP